jgi:hypothetical protein
MTMLIKESGPAQPNKKPALKNIKINDAVFDIVEFFYPRPDNFPQVLPLYMRPQDIMNVMNCSEDEAYKLFKEIQNYYGEEYEYIRVLIPHFCNYMGVDELWIHLFLASLNPHKQFYQQQTTVTQPGNVSITREQPSKLAQAIENLKNGVTVSRETLKERAKMWELLNPLGELMAKRISPYRVVIYADEVAAILRMHLRTAQKILQDIRKEANMPKKSHVSIKKFCHFYFRDEAAEEEKEIRKALNIMYGEDNDEE